MTRLALWRLAAGLCGLALWLVTPFLVLTTWLAKLARAGEAHSGIEVLHAMAQLRVQRALPKTNKTRTQRR